VPGVRRERERERERQTLIVDGVCSATLGQWYRKKETEIEIDKEGASECLLPAVDSACSATFGQQYGESGREGVREGEREGARLGGSESAREQSEGARE